MPEKVFILRVDPDYLVVKKDDGYGAVEYIRADIVKKRVEDAEENEHWAGIEREEKREA